MTSSSSRDISPIRFIILPPFSPSLTLKTSYISKLFTKGVVFPISIWWPLLLIITPSCSLLYYTKLVSVILSASKIILTCSHCAEKGLIYVAITSPTSRQPLLCAECTKANIYSLCDVRSTFNTEYTLLISFYNLLVPYLIYYKVLYSNSC